MLDRSREGQRPRILNAEPDRYSPRARAALEEVAEVTEQTLDRDGLARTLPGYEALIVRRAHRIDAALLDAAPRLRAIATCFSPLR
jgi:phosphoglycerate dehydrogenase-like enzyme